MMPFRRQPVVRHVGGVRAKIKSMLERFVAEIDGRKQVFELSGGCGQETMAERMGIRASLFAFADKKLQKWQEKQYQGACHDRCSDWPFDKNCRRAM